MEEGCTVIVDVAGVEVGGAAVLVGGVYVDTEMLEEDADAEVAGGTTTVDVAGPGTADADALAEADERVD